MYETATGQFEVVSKLAAGGIALWWRENLENGHQWHGPYRILNEDVDPIMLAQLEDERPILICKSGEKLIKLV